MGEHRQLVEREGRGSTPRVECAGESWPPRQKPTRYIQSVRELDIRPGEATRLPLDDNSVAVLYSSHMLEHLDREEALGFVREARRVLQPGGILRVVVPDLKRLAEDYLRDGDADAFMERTLLAEPRARSFTARTKLLVVGQRNHLWMYDARSLSNILTTAGFHDVSEMPPNETRIPDPGELDLAERSDESVYVEGVA